MAENIGIITEQGDLGLGFDVIQGKDQAVAENYCKKTQDTSVPVDVVVEDKKN